MQKHLVWGALCLLLIFSIPTHLSAQSLGDLSSAASFVHPPAIGNIGKTASSIVSMLGSKLNLNSGQSSGVSSAVTDFLTKKSGIIGQAKTDPTSYLSSFKGLQGGLFDKLKGIFTADQFTKFLKLKPSSSNASKSVLGNLFY
jgi:hypothetical protein